MKRPPKRVGAYDGEAAYPSLAEHRRDRRRILLGGVALLGGGSLAACTRLLGPGWDDNPQVDGGIQLPEYLRVRIPAVDDRGVYLIDGGFARWFAVALTYVEDCAAFATDAREAIGARFDALIGERTYDELVTADGTVLEALREALRADLDAAYNEDTGDAGTWWFEAVELTFTRLDAPISMGGVPRAEPSYP